MKVLIYLMMMFGFISSSYAFICCFDGRESIESLQDNYNIQISALPGGSESDAHDLASQIVSTTRNGLRLTSYTRGLKILYVSRTGIKDKCFINVNESDVNLPEIYKYHDIVVSPCGELRLLNFISSN